MTEIANGIYMACLVIVMCSISTCSDVYEMKRDLHRLVQIQEKAAKP